MNLNRAEFVFSNFKDFVSFSIKEMQNKNTKYVLDYLFEDFDIDMTTNFASETLKFLLENRLINQDIFVYAFSANILFRKLEKNERSESSILNSVELLSIKILLSKIETILKENKINVDQNQFVLDLMK